MPRTQQGIVLTTTPVQVDVAADDNIAFRDLTISCQTAGTLVICEDVASYATGFRVAVAAGDLYPWDRISGSEDVWLASPDGVEVDILELGVA